MQITKRGCLKSTSRIVGHLALIKPPLMFLHAFNNKFQKENSILQILLTIKNQSMSRGISETVVSTLVSFVINPFKILSLVIDP